MSMLRLYLETGLKIDPSHTTAYEPVVLSLDAKKDQEIIYGVQARGYFEIGLLKEKLGLKSEAIASLTCGSEILEKRTLDKVNEVQKSEQRETLLALARLSFTFQDGSEQSTDTNVPVNAPENDIVAVSAYGSGAATDNERTEPSHDLGLKESLDSMQLCRRLVLKYTPEWHVYQDWTPPRRRDGRKWEKVDWANKFFISNGENTFIIE